MKALVPVTLALALALPPPPRAAGRRQRSRPPRFRGTVDFVQRLDQGVPGGLRFRDERGTAVNWRLFAWGRRPWSFPTTAARTCVRRRSATSPSAWPRRATPRTRRRCWSSALIRRTSRASPTCPSTGPLDALLFPPEQERRWHFLSGAPADISRLAQSVGFHYGYDEATHQYAHPAGFALITPEGRIARYFFGFDFSADQLGSAFDQAARRRIASPIERLLLACFHDQLRSGVYTRPHRRGPGVMAVLVVVALLALTSILLRRARRRRTAESDHGLVPFFPDRASTIASKIDNLYFAWLALSGVVALAVAVLIVWFVVRYRRGRAPADIGDPVRMIEDVPHQIVWTVVPSRRSWACPSAAPRSTTRAPPYPERVTIYVVAKQWMWQLEHPEGEREINELHVPVGRPVRADDDLAGRDPQLLDSGVPDQAGRAARAIHDALVHGRPSRRLPPVLHGVSAARSTRG